MWFWYWLQYRPTVPNQCPDLTIGTGMVLTLDGNSQNGTTYEIKSYSDFLELPYTYITTKNGLLPHLLPRFSRPIAVWYFIRNRPRVKWGLESG